MRHLVILAIVAICSISLLFMPSTAFAQSASPIENLSASKTPYSFTITWDDNGASSYTVRVIEPGYFNERVEITTSDNFVTVNDLKPETLYKIVVAPDGDFESKSMITKTTKAAAVLENLEVIVDGNALEISWDAQSDVTDYTVRVIKPGHYDDRLEYTTTNSTTTVSDLKPDTEYRIVVLPNGHSQAKAAQHITTSSTTTPAATQQAASPTQPDSIQNLDVQFTHNTISVTWDDDFANYEVRVTAPGFQALGLSHDNSHDFDGLTPDTDYTITVAPAGDESKMATKEIRTLSAPSDTLTNPPARQSQQAAPAPQAAPTPQPDSIQNLDVQFTHDTISITWDDDFANYEVRVFPVGQYTPGEFITANSYSVNGLTPDTDYRIVVVPDGVEDKKAAQEIRTLSLQSIQNFSATATDNSLNITWDDNGAAQYTVRVIEPGFYNDRVERTTSDNFIQIDNLKSDTEYKLVVFATADEDTKSIIFTTTLTLATTQLVPQPQQAAPASLPQHVAPSAPQIRGATSTDSSVSINWDDIGAAEYTVRAIEPGFYDDRVEITTSDNFITVNDLKSDTEYRLVVFATADEDAKSIIRIPTKTSIGVPPTPPGQPDSIQNLDVTFTHDTALATWDDDFTNYTVSIYGATIAPIYDQPIDNSYNFDNLVPSTKYTIVVIPNHDATKKAIHEFRTLPLPQSDTTQNPDVQFTYVTFISVTSTHNSINAQWNAAPDNPTYQVTLFDIDNGNFITSITTDQTSYVARDLDHDTNYRLIVAVADNYSETLNTAELSTKSVSTSDILTGLRADNAFSTDTTASIPYDSIRAHWNPHDGKTEVRVSQPYASTTSASYIINDIEPETDYRIVVVPNGDETKRGAIQVTTLHIDPARPLEIPFTLQNVYVNPTGDSMIISWDQYQDATDYTVRLIQQPKVLHTGSGTLVETLPPLADRTITQTTADTTIEISDLKFNTKYQVEVFETGNEATSRDPGPPMFVKTLPGGSTPIVPGAVQNIDAFLFDHNIYISWDDDFESYEVRIFDAGLYTLDNADGVIVDQTSSNSYDFTPLKSNTSYTIELIPDGDESKKITREFTTLVDTSDSERISPSGYRTDGNSIFSPGNSKTSISDTIQRIRGDITYNSISLTWDDDFSIYEVRAVESDLYETSLEIIKEKSNAINGLYVKQTSDHSATFDGLQPSTSYAVKAFVVGARNSGDTVSVTTIGTPNPAPPSNLRGVQVANSIVFSWDHDRDFDSFTIRDAEGLGDVLTATSSPAQWTSLLPSSYTTRDYNIRTEIAGAESINSARVEVHATTEAVQERINDVLVRKFQPIVDTFSDASTWNVESSVGPGRDSFNNYKFSIYEPRGEPKSYGLISGDGLSSEFAITQEISLTNWNSTTDDLYLILDYRATSDEGRTETTTAYLQITTTDGEVLFDTNMCSCALTDSGWRTYTKDIADIVNGETSFILKLYEKDVYAFDWNQDTYYDKLYIGPLPNRPF